MASSARGEAIPQADAAQLFERALSLHGSGLLTDAMAVYRQVLGLAPDHFNALYLLGRLECGARSYREAETLLTRAVQADPQSADAHLHLGIVLAALQRYPEARARYREAIALKPDDALALNNLGGVCRHLDQPQEALESYDRAIAVHGDLAELHYNRGLLLLDLARYDEALAGFDRALAINPRYAAALGDRGNALYRLARYAEALESYDRAVALEPASAGAWSNRAQVLLGQNRVSDAIASCQRALAVSPNVPDPHALVMLGQCFERLGRIKEAIAACDAALAIKPDIEAAISNKIFCLDFAENADFEMLRDARRVWWERIGTRLAASPPDRHPNDRDPDRRLVIGYVSSDFRLHSAALAFKPVLRRHDKTQLEVVCYACWPQQDAVTQEFRQMADRWRDASQWSDERLAAQIRADAVDILIDLSGHTEGNRLGVFARKPAPIQVHG